MNRGFLVKTNAAEAEAAQLACHQYMQATVPGYTADRWAYILKKGNANEYAIYVDERVSMALSSEDRAAVIDELPGRRNRNKNQSDWARDNQPETPAPHGKN